MTRAKLGLTLTTALGAGLLIASAYAQQPAPNAPTPAPQTPTTTTQAGTSAAPTGSSQPATSTQPSQQAQPQQGQTQQSQRGGLSADDRAAFVEARLASIHTGLRLTPDQDRLWPPVESAVRDMARTMAELRDQRRSQAAPADPVERMARLGDAATRRGQAMTRLAEAARPLYSSLNDDQKRRLRFLLRGPGRNEGPRGMMMGRDDERGGGHWRGPDHDRRMMMMHRWERDRFYDRGDRDGRGYRGEDRSWRDDRGYRGEDRNWRDGRQGFRDEDHDDWRDRRDYDRDDRRGNDWR